MSLEKRVSLTLDKFLLFIPEKHRGSINMKGQLSAEMLILIVVILAIVAIAASQLLKTTETTAGKVDAQSERLLEKTDKALKEKSGGVCASDEDCLSKRCDLNTYRCD